MVDKSVLGKASGGVAEPPGSIAVWLCYWILVQMVPPMLLSFIVPITDRYLFLPSVGICILLAHVTGRLAKAHWLAWGLLAGLAMVWGVKAASYVSEWRDPRSVWCGAHCT